MSGNNTRASLLSGLRTGGVRASPGPAMPQTAALGGSFQPPRFAATHHQPGPFDDSQNDMSSFAGMRYSGPMTAALDGRAPRFQQQQQQMQLMQQAQMVAMAGMPGMQGMLNSVDPAQAQLLHLQLMQAMIAQQQQAQKLQAEVALQHHVAMALNNQRQPSPRAPSQGSRIPSTAGPSQSTFNLPPNPVQHARQDQQFGFDDEHDFGTVPMTAALGGKFGSRGSTSTLNPNAPTFKMSSEADQQTLLTPVAPPNTASTTVVISGGVSLGGPNVPPTPNPSTGPSKSDSASSWRRPSNATPPVGIRSGTPPKPVGRQSPPVASNVSPEVAKYSPSESPAPLPRYRPQPIRLRESSPFAPSVTIDHDQGQSLYSLSKLGKPPSPTGSNSSGDSFKVAAVVRHSMPVRQPRGPPASVEELIVKNFARRTSRSTSAPMMVMPEAHFVTAY